MNGVVLLAIRDGSTSVPVPTTPQVMDMGGRGLVLVEMLSHEWDASTDGSESVWRPSPSEPGPRPLNCWHDPATPWGRRIYLLRQVGSPAEPWPGPRTAFVDSALRTKECATRLSFSLWLRE